MLEEEGRSRGEDFSFIHFCVISTLLLAGVAWFGVIL